MGDPGIGEPGMGEPGMGVPPIGEPGIGDPSIGEPGIGEPGNGELGIQGEPGTGESVPGVEHTLLSPSDDSQNVNLGTVSVAIEVTGGTSSPMLGTIGSRSSEELSSGEGSVISIAERKTQENGFITDSTVIANTNYERLHSLSSIVLLWPVYGHV